MTIHHHETYFSGYSVLPKLLPLSGPIFEMPDQEILTLKQEALKHQQCYVESDLDPIVDYHVCEYIRWVMGRDFEKENASCNFSQLAPKLNEDVAIHCVDDKRDWLAAAHICFPSGWLPEEKAGKSFLEIHSPVPGMRRDNSHKLAKMMVSGSYFERYVWGVIFEDRINGHPRIPKKQFDINNPVLFIRYERQIVVGFPELSTALFVIGQNLISEREIYKATLKKSLGEMTEEQRIYKGINDSYDDLMKYLSLAD